VVRRGHLRRLLTNAKKATVSVLYWYGKLQIFQFLRKARLVFAFSALEVVGINWRANRRTFSRICERSGPIWAR